MDKYELYRNAISLPIASARFVFTYLVNDARVRDFAITAVTPAIHGEPPWIDVQIATDSEDVWRALTLDMDRARHHDTANVSAYTA